jgi:hypothetical protein
VLIGRKSYILSNLEASLSANLTVQRSGPPLLHIGPPKAIANYDQLFGLYIYELPIVGK